MAADRIPFSTLISIHLSSPEPTIQDLPDDPGPDEPDSSQAEPGDLANPIQIEVVCNTETNDPGLNDWLEAQVRDAIERCGVKQAQLTFAIVADEEMADLHEQYSGVPGTTDVLTFDLSDQAEGGSPPVSEHDATSLEGDIILCIDEAKRQANERNHETRHELLLYAVHGLMHLLGEDDKTEAGFERMHAREDALLNEMGFGPLFDPDRDPKP